jgi:hypothetical protein
MQRRLAVAMLWMCLSAFEIVLIGRFDAQETPAGVGIALLAALVTAGALKAAGLSYRLQASWLWLPLLVVRNVVRDTFGVYGVLLRHLCGGTVKDAFLDIPFDWGGDDPASAARRALAVAGISTSPNEIVLALDRDRGTARVHALAITGARRHSAQWPL